jgi:cytochrome P450
MDTSEPLLSLEKPDPFDVSRPSLYRDDSWRPLFAQLRSEQPVYYCPHSRSGPYWSITRYDDIVRVDTDSTGFSSSHDYGGVTIEDRVAVTFMQMDPPIHTAKRKNAAPIVAPRSLVQMESLIRERAGRVLDELPRNEDFDWVENVSIELTSMMLTTLFGYPVEARRKLVHWSNVLTADLEDPDSPIRSEAERQAGLADFYMTMVDLWERRQKEEEPGFDIISLLAHDPAVRAAPYEEIIALFGLFLVGGNDTTRNSMSGGAWGFSRFPEEWSKLKANPKLISNAAAEIIRFQTPVIYQRRTATTDVEIGGKTIKAGDKVVIWYISGNRDESVFADPDALRVERPNARQHLSFGMGPHRCLGARLAELQLRVLWEEVLSRDLEIEVLTPPTYAFSNLVRSPVTLPVRIRG